MYVTLSMDSTNDLCNVVNKLEERVLKNMSRPQKVSGIRIVADTRYDDKYTAKIQQYTPVCPIYEKGMRLTFTLSFLEHNDMLNCFNAAIESSRSPWPTTSSTCKEAARHPKQKLSDQEGLCSPGTPAKGQESTTQALACQTDQRLWASPRGAWQASDVPMVCFAALIQLVL